MKNFGIVLLFLILLLAVLFYFRPMDNKAIPFDDPTTAQIETSKWELFKPRSGLFTVELPHPPQYAQDNVDIPGTDLKRHYDMYASEEIDGTLFLISVITYPNEAEASEPLDLMKQTIDEMMKAKPDNKLKKMNLSQFKSLQSFDFNFVNGDFLVEGKIFMLGKTIYVLSYVSRQGQYDADEYQRFIESFDILDKEGAK